MGDRGNPGEASPGLSSLGRDGGVGPGHGRVNALGWLALFGVISGSWHMATSRIEIVVRVGLGPSRACLLFLLFAGFTKAGTLSDPY